jgi:hypothetical protein
MNALYRAIFFLAAFIMNGCMDSDMNELQLRAKSGQLVPGSSQRLNFQLPFFLNPAGKVDPGSYVVQLSLDDPNPAGGPFRVEAKAEIIWSVSGNGIRRVVDCVNGMSISGVAEGVAVSIFDTSTVGGGNPLPYQVSVQVSKGNRASIQQPPFYTLPVNIIAPSSFIATEIPQGIGAISARVDIAPVTVGGVIPEFGLEVLQQYGGGTLKAYQPRVGWVPLAPAARTISVVSAALADSTYISIVLGIDG